MCNKEIATKAVNTILRKTLGRLDVQKQYQIARWFGFRITDQHIQPAQPEFHLPVRPRPDGALPIARGIPDEEESGFE